MAIRKRRCCGRAKSLRKLAARACSELGPSRSAARVVGGVAPHGLDYSLQANRKTFEGEELHPDRDAQFGYIDDHVTECQEAGQAGVSVDTKKKELVGNYKNAGQEWHPMGQPDKVKVHDFIDPNSARRSLTGCMTWTPMPPG